MHVMKAAYKCYVTGRGEATLVVKLNICEANTHG